MGGLQPWHWLIMFVVFGVIVVGVVLAVVLIVRAFRPKSPPPAAGTAPGWYPDPGNPAAQRYFDGRVWTASTRPPG